MKTIAARSNQQFKALRLLAKDPGEQRRQQRCLIDGSHLVTAYCDKLGPPELLIVSEHGQSQAEIQALLERLRAVPLLLLKDDLFEALSQLSTPAGIMALIHLPQAPVAQAACASCLLLDAVQDAGNVGAILRSAAAAGIGEVYLGAGCAGVWMPRVLRAAQGAHFDLALHEQADLPRVAKGFSGAVVAATASAGDNLYQLELRGPIAWLFGNEGAGISPDLLATASVCANIPMASGSESLNVAAAAAVCLFEEVRQKRFSNGGKG